MKAKVVSMVPQVDAQTGAQRSFSTQNGTFYCFIAEMSDGVKGEVSGKTAGTHRFKAGDEVEYTYMASINPQYLGKLKLEQIGGGFGGKNGGGNWSPEKEVSVATQGYLKSIIEAGIPSAQWSQALAQAFVVHDSMVAQRLAKAAPVAQPAPQPQVAPAFGAQPLHLNNPDSIRAGQSAPLPQEPAPF